MPNIVYEHFWFTTGPIALAAPAGSVNQATIVIGSDADFRCKFITGVALQAGLAVANFGGLISITSSDSGKGWSNAPIGFINLSGTGQQPYPWEIPILLKKATTIVVAAVNSAAAVATVVEIAFHGYKLLEV